MTVAVDRPIACNQGPRVNCVITRRLLARFTMTMTMIPRVIPLVASLNTAPHRVEGQCIEDHAAGRRYHQRCMKSSRR